MRPSSRPHICHPSRSLILIQALDFTHIYEIVCPAQKYHTLYINYIGVSPPKTLIFTKTRTMATGRPVRLVLNSSVHLEPSSSAATGDFGEPVLQLGAEALLQRLCYSLTLPRDQAVRGGIPG
jgi:hypothetical protein